MSKKKYFLTALATLAVLTITMIPFAALAVDQPGIPGGMESMARDAGDMARDAVTGAGDLLDDMAGGDSGNTGAASDGGAASDNGTAGTGADSKADDMSSEMSDMADDDKSGADGDNISHATDGSIDTSANGDGEGSGMSWVWMTICIVALIAVIVIIAALIPRRRR